jgi:hypothetical protein
MPPIRKFEEYLARREQKAEEVRQRIESQQGDLSEIRARLLNQRFGLGQDMLRLLADENFNSDLVRALLLSQPSTRSRRWPTFVAETSHSSRRGLFSWKSPTLYAHRLGVKKGLS